MSESNIEVADRPHPGQGKLRGAMKQFMDLMVDGLSLPIKDGRRLYDLIVVGGGSAGLAAAMDSARSGLNTLVIERADVDQTGGSVECVRCCPDITGWPPGLKPGDSSANTTECFNLEMLLGMEVRNIRDEGLWKVIVTNGGKEYWGKAILLSPGTRYRRLGVPGEVEFIGSGIHHCAGCEGPAYAGKEVLVVGSSDYGIEEALALADYASKVTVVEPGDRLMCNQGLADLAKHHIKLEIRLNSRVLEFKSQDVLRDFGRRGERLGSVLVEDFRNGKVDDIPAAAVFVFTGADPNTDFLWGAVELDPWGFIKVGRDSQTSMEGVYVAGDARSARIIGAMEPEEDGVAAVSAIRQFLAEKIALRG